MSAGFSFISSPLNAKSDENHEEINSNCSNEITPTAPTPSASTGFSFLGTPPTGSMQSVSNDGSNSSLPTTGLNEDEQQQQQHVSSSSTEVIQDQEIKFAKTSSIRSGAKKKKKKSSIVGYARSVEPEFEVDNNNSGSNSTASTSTSNANANANANSDNNIHGYGQVDNDKSHYDSQHVVSNADSRCDDMNDSVVQTTTTTTATTTNNNNNNNNQR